MKTIKATLELYHDFDNPEHARRDLAQHLQAGGIRVNPDDIKVEVVRDDEAVE